MECGIAHYFTLHSMRPDALGRALEERRFESLWCPEHSHMPAPLPAKAASGAGYPAEYAEVMDPFIALTAAAMATSVLKIGTGICQVTQRDPIITAKQVASLDQLSGGRFLFGVGAGWNAQEMQHHGTRYASRFKLMGERIEAMRAIWTQSSPEYHGEFVDFGPINLLPKPFQKPHPPILVGGTFPHSARRAVEYGDGWMPTRTRPEYPDVTAFLPEFQRMVMAAGRNINDVPVTLWAASANPDRLKHYRDLGIARVVFYVRAKATDELLPLLDRWEPLVSQLKS